MFPITCLKTRGCRLFNVRLQVFCFLWPILTDMIHYKRVLTVADVERRKTALHFDMYRAMVSEAWRLQRFPGIGYPASSRWHRNHMHGLQGHACSLSQSSLHLGFDDACVSLSALFWPTKSRASGLKVLMYPFQKYRHVSQSELVHI